MQHRVGFAPQNYPRGGGVRGGGKPPPTPSRAGVDRDWLQPPERSGWASPAAERGPARCPVPGAPPPSAAVTGSPPPPSPALQGRPPAPCCPLMSSAYAFPPQRIFLPGGLGERRNALPRLPTARPVQPGFCGGPARLSRPRGGRGRAGGGRGCTSGTPNPAAGSEKTIPGESFPAPVKGPRGRARLLQLPPVPGGTRSSSPLDGGGVGGCTLAP